MDELIRADIGSARLALEDMAKRRTELRGQCEAAVVERRWAAQGSELQRPQPLYHKRYGLPAPRLLDDAPRVPRDEQQYGFSVLWDLAQIDPGLGAAIGAIAGDDEGAPERARVTLNRAARRLQKLDWPSIAPVTDDFVVFAVDDELVDLAENFAFSVPAGLRKALAGRGLV